MANATSAAIGETHGFTREETARLPSWIAPVLGLLLVLTGLAISHVPFPNAPTLSPARQNASVGTSVAPANAGVQPLAAAGDSAK